MNKICITFSVLFFVRLSQACGPWLPDPYLLRNDTVFYAPPEVGFAAELEHLLPESVPHSAVLDGEEAGGASAVDELRAALNAAELEPGKRETIVADFREFRQQLNTVKPYLDRQPYPYGRFTGGDEEQKTQLEQLHLLEVPQDLPDEFRLYLEGALAYYRDDLTSARKRWCAVLRLPEGQRQYRSVMAAYMLAKTNALEPETYEHVRELAAAGYADSLGLAAASYGRQAQVYLQREDFKPAIDLYLKQWASGYWNAIQSLEITAANAWSSWDHPKVNELVKNKQGRAVLTAYLLTQHESDTVRVLRKRLLEALPDVDSLAMAEAGRFALIEYQQNNLTAARLWLSYAGANDALALWVRSKLLLRAGRIDEGRTLMLALTESFGKKEPEWRRLNTARAWGELGLLYMADERYKDAADAFWNAGSWTDCAYVLERLLPTEEVLAWLGSHRQGSEPGRMADARALAARRLMREAKFDEALELFDADARAAAEDYIRSMRAAYDNRKDAPIRAQHFWAAANILRHKGLQLIAAELTPDYAWVDGQFDWIDIQEARNEARWTGDYQINEVPYDEDSLAQRTRVQPNKRFHYRYRAIQLAELAAGLLPNNDENAARIYLVAASWIKNRDPSSADRLYKQLAVRCADTDLGKAAREVNWFPEVELKDFQPFAE